MSADNLPRPDVLDGSPLPPGPWALGPDLDVLDAHGDLILRAESAPGGIGALATVACLPEIIDERDDLARRMDAVREWAESMPDAYPESLLAADEEHGARIYASGMCNAAAMVLEILGDGEAGDE